jgi:hypothetical protein
MVLAVMVTGCTVLDSSAPDTSPSDSASASPSASAPATHASEPSAEAPLASAPPTTRDDQSPRPFDGYLGNEMIIEPVDSGKRPGATGTVTVNKEGEPAYYTVASGDYLDQILARLYMDPYYLENLNSVRRDGSLGDYYVGDVLNLDPTTIAYVGSDNGVVYDNPIITPHPRQVKPSF